MKRILHIVPHFGGGVGRVLGNIALASPKSSFFENEFIFLDRLGEESRRNVEKYSLTVYPLEKIADRVEQADIVQIDWWNHPLLAKFLGSFRMPPCRLLIYSHISGMHYPNILTKDVVNYCDRFVASTEYSLKNHPVLQGLTASCAPDRVSAIHSCSGLSRVADVRKKPHSEFNVGYVGTLDFCKLHPDFVKMSAAANIPHVKFSIYGTGNDYDTICQQVAQMRAADRFHMYGYVEDIASVFSTMDVLGYPLNPCHYGTGEQVLIESLGAGVPAVVMNNGPESLIIRHGYNGMIAESPEEYSSCLEYLANHPALVDEMGQNAREYAQQKFTIQIVLDQFDRIYDDMLTEPRKERELLSQHFTGVSGDLVYFLSSLGDHSLHYIESATSTDISRLFEADKKIAQENVPYAGNAKGTIFQYKKYFSHDSFLTFWCGLIMLERGEYEKALEYFLDSTELGFKHWRVNWYSWCALFALRRNIPGMNISSDMIEKAESSFNVLSRFFGEKFTFEILRRVNGLRN